MNPALEFFVMYLLFPGIVFSYIFGLLFEGIDRKIAAHMQSRIGPPILQPFYDIGKLFTKEDITPEKSQSMFFNGAPLIAFGAVITAMIMIPVTGVIEPLGGSLSLIVVLYLLNIPAIALIIGGYASSSPFGVLGSNRYIIQLIGYELIFIITAITAAVHAGSYNLASGFGNWFIFQAPLAAAAMLLAAPGKLLKTPFDIPEAETEIVMGPLTEYSGPKLALFKITHNIELLAIAGLFTALFLGGPVPVTIGAVTIPGVVTFLIQALVVAILITLIRCVTARLRIHQALKFYWGPIGFVAFLSLILALVVW